MKRRDVLQLAAFGAATLVSRSARDDAAGQTPPTTAADVPEQTIAELQAAMAGGSTSSRAVTERYLDRIESIDRRGPAINSVIELNPDALETAEALDRERASRGVRGPLHGIPILLKDNIDTADRMKTTAGSLALADWTPPRDAFLVTRLREAGAVILGKTNLSEWANFRSTRSTSGWSGRGGLTRNPYVLDRNACGSSTGSAVAVAANLCAAAIGTETDGSIVCPATANGIVGLKPTLGLVSRSGIIPIAASQDTAGPMARTVADAAAVLGALTGLDPGDAVTRASRTRLVRDYTAGLTTGGLKGMRLGVMRNFFGFHDGVDRLLASALDAMKDAGAVLVDPANLATKDDFEKEELDVLLYEFKAGVGAYLGALPASSPRAVARRPDCIQRDACDAGDALVRPGAAHPGAEEGATHEPRLHEGTPGVRRAIADARTRRGDDEASPRCTRRAHRRSGLADRSRQRRPLHWRQFDARGRGRVSQHLRPGRPGAGTSGRRLVHGTPVERPHAAAHRLRVRTGDEVAAPADLHGDGAPRVGR